MNISKTSSWNEEEIAAFLESAVIPVRIATVTGAFPTLCSIWYAFDDTSGDIVCASHQNSRLVADLSADDRCAFEIAANDPPYHGVRGRARVMLTRDGVAPMLERLITRYLGTTDSDLARWLLGRSEEEYLLRLRLTRITAWDYSGRMSG